MSFKIKAEKREVFGKNASRRLRKEGMVPVILYGSNEVNVPLTLEKEALFKILRSETGENTVFEVSFNSETRNAMIKDLQLDPVSDEILHADLIQIAMDKVVRVSIPVVTIGDAVGIKTEGGFIDFVTREIEVECLPKDIPEHIEINISHLHLRQSFKVGDVDVPEGVKLITEPDSILVHIEIPTKEEEIEVEKEAEEEVISEEEEPEVIKKEKPAEEEEEKKKKRGKEEE
ncbi:MAG: 50S ribosomal protein L25 [Candidatus Aminicenantes bacterium]|nr:50S ribosomal protein L25 [Candidatus Aminicenantes bacterium]MDH5466490.1 50S ribosomal protein L25 [Candidatus Aminicenantes bacterium]MDH5704381.1 50S ribosomal protein L25 [Candidatus Aminicenantes bacterium]